MRVKPDNRRGEHRGGNLIVASSPAAPRVAGPLPSNPAFDGADIRNQFIHAGSVALELGEHPGRGRGTSRSSVLRRG